MTIIVGTNPKLLHMLGITQKHVIEADIRLRGDEIATVTLTCAADVDSDQLTTARFMLQALDPEPAAAPAPPAPALDLDAMCAAAQQRLATAVNHSAEWTLAEWREESAAIHVRMNKALRLHRKEAAEIMMRQEFLQAIRELICDLNMPLIQLAQSGLMGAGAIGGLSSALASINDSADAFHFGHGIGLGGNLNGKCRGGI